MANYSSLKAAIQNVIKTNGNNEITGSLLQQTLITIVESLGNDYQFNGVAEPSTNPGTPDQNVAYIAGPGTYPNFNATTVPDGRLGVFLYNGSWTIKTVVVGKNYDDDISEINEIINGVVDITPSVNRYDKTKNGNGYLNSSGGISTDTSGNYIYSLPIPIRENRYYFLSGRTLNNAFNIRCLDANGNAMKVRIAATGEEYSGWELPNEAGTGRAVNGQFKTPSGAVSVQFNVVFGGVGSPNNVMLSEIGASYIASYPTPAFVPYADSYAIKESALPPEIRQDLDQANFELFGGQYSQQKQSVQTDAGRYPSTSYSGAMVTTSQNWTILNYPIVAGRKYQITIPKSPNTAAYSIVYRTYLDSYSAGNNIVPLTDTVGTSGAMNYTIESAQNYPYISVCYDVAGGLPTVVETYNASPRVVKVTPQQYLDEEKQQARENIGAASEAIAQDVNAMHDAIYYKKPKTVSWVNDLLATTSNVSSGVGYFRTYSGWRCTLPILLNAGETAHITTVGNGSYLLTPIVQVSGPDAKVSNSYSYQAILVNRIDNNQHEYTYTATEDMWIVLCGIDGCVISFDINDTSRITEIEDELKLTSPRLKGKKIYFFGASNTSNSTPGVVGFPELIANAAGLPYRPFVYDSNDGNTADVPISYPAVTNYAKDGTCLRVISGRSDGVVPRIKRHILAATDVDYIILGFPANDAAQANLNMGEMEESYTANFDLDTQLGALEDVCKYVTELGKPIRFGCIIMWKITWVDNDFYNPYIPVLKKWGIPFLDLRDIAGFDIKNCAAHRNLYSLTAENYSSWDANTTYNLDDRVKYGGVLYKCNADGVTGIVPTNSQYWVELSSDSGDGTHLNSVGNEIVVGKILSFIESL